METFRIISIYTGELNAQADDDRGLRDVERVPTLSLIAGKSGLGVAVMVRRVTDEG